MSDLSLVPFDDLVAELARRNDASVVCTFKNLGGDKAAEAVRFHGHYRICQGLQARADMVRTEEPL